MDRVEGPRGLDARVATIGLLGMGAASGVLWGVVTASSPGAAIAELPQVAALTFGLGALCLFVTARAGVALQGYARGGASGARWARVATTGGAYGVAGLVVLSILLLANGVLYFALDRAWPISPADAGRVQFFVLAAMILVPVAVALLALSARVTSRLRSGTT